MLDRLKSSLCGMLLYLHRIESCTWTTFFCLRYRFFVSVIVEPPPTALPRTHTCTSFVTGSGLCCRLDYSVYCFVFVSIKPLCSIHNCPLSVVVFGLEGFTALAVGSRVFHESKGNSLQALVREYISFTCPCFAPLEYGSKL